MRAHKPSWVRLRQPLRKVPIDGASMGGRDLRAARWRVQPWTGIMECWKSGKKGKWWNTAWMRSEEIGLPRVLRYITCFERKPVLSCEWRLQISRDDTSEFFSEKLNPERCIDKNFIGHGEFSPKRFQIEASPHIREYFPFFWGECIPEEQRWAF